jgi:hypothetical protein
VNVSFWPPPQARSSPPRPSKLNAPVTPDSAAVSPSNASLKSVPMMLCVRPVGRICTGRAAPEFVIWLAMI